MRKIPKEEIEEIVENSTTDTEESIEETLKDDESFSLKVEVPRATEQEIFEAIKSSLCVCNDCHTRFIKRKSKLSCPICHSTNIS